jgi:hypothetical protein
MGIKPIEIQMIPLGVIMSYYGWNGKDDSSVFSKLLAALIALRNVGIDKNLIIEMNDSGFTFEEIASYIDRFGKQSACRSESIFVQLTYSI